MSPRTLAIGCLVIACLVVGSQAACSFDPTKVTNGNVTVPGAKLLFTVMANGTREFNCSTGKPVDTGRGTANYTGSGYTGYFYYNASGVPINLLKNSMGSTKYVSAPVSTFSFAPAPNGALGWLRGPISSTEGPGPMADFVTRTNTTGGTLSSCPSGQKLVNVSHVSWFIVSQLYWCWLAVSYRNHSNMFVP